MIVLGIDAGTQSTKALFYDVDKRKVLGVRAAAYPLISREDGSREQKAEWWMSALQLCLADAPKEWKRQVGAIGVSGQQHGFVPLDAKGHVLANVKLWCDTSTWRECEQITKAYGGERRMVEKVGNPILPGYTASKVLWLKKHWPALYRKLAWILLPHDYINYFLTGELCAEAGDASGTGFFNVYKRQWDQALLKAMDAGQDLLKKLPRFLAAGEMAGKLTPKAAKLLGLTPGIIVSAGGGDNMMAAIGTGAVKEGLFTLSLGTSGTLFAYAKRAISDPQGRLAAFCSSSGGWLPLLCTMNCTVATEILRELLGTGLAEMEKLAGAVKEGSDGLVLLPYFNGERVPNLPRGKGCLLGMTPRNSSRGHLLRAAMEAAIFGMQAGLEAFAEKGLKPSKLRVVGGGSRSKLWRQMAADILGYAVEVPLQEEAAAFGAALQALWCLQGGRPGALEDLCSQHVLIDEAKAAEPKRSNQTAYQEARKNREAYREALQPLFS